MHHTKYLNKSKAQPTLYIYGHLASFLKSPKNVTELYFKFKTERQ